jgi:hypothetical protein
MLTTRGLVPLIDPTPHVNSKLTHYHADYLCDSKTLELNKAQLFLSLAESGKRWLRLLVVHGHTRGRGLAI